MTAAQDEGWIEGSLARLETLEVQRQQLAARGQSAALAEVEEEIKALYEVLESAAGEGQAPANTGMAAAPMSMAPPMGVVPPPGMGMVPPPGMGMVPAPMGVAPAPMGMAPAPGMGAAPMGMSMAPPPMGMAPSTPGMVMEPMLGSSSLEMLERPSRSPLPFIIGGVAVLIVGIAVVAMSSGDKEAKPAPTEAAKEIKAGAISEDTQEPVVAKGADADRTAGTKYSESPEADRPERRTSSGSSGVSRPRPTKKEEDEGRKLEVEKKTRDPLAGI